MSMRKIDLKELVEKKVSKTHRNIGCILFPFKMFMVMSIVAFLFFNLLEVKNKKSISGVLPGMAFEGAVVLFAVIWMKWLASRIRKNCEIEKSGNHICVDVDEAEIVKVYIKETINKNPNVREQERECFFALEMEGAIVELCVGMSTYIKHNVGEKVYIIKINESYYGDLIFDQRKYYLDELGKKALEEDIKIYI